METYKNSYSVKEDEVLWELHEIRHSLHEELKKRPLAEINKAARDVFEEWKYSWNESQDPVNSPFANKERS